MLVLGAGKIGAHKARQLLDAGAAVTIIAAEVNAELPEVKAVEVRRYVPGDLAGYFLVVSAIGGSSVNDEIVAEADRLKVWLNVVDDPERSSFYFTAMRREGDVVISVSTEGSSPALAQILRDRLSDALPSNVAEVARQLRNERNELHEQGSSTEDIDWKTRVNSLLGGSPRGG